MLSFLENIRVILFDFDGPLVNNFQELFVEIVAVARSFGVQENLTGKIKKHWGESLDFFLSNVMPGISHEMFLRRSAELGFRKKVPLHVPGARRTLALLKEHYILGIVTNRGRPSLMEILNAREFDIRNFAFIVTATDLPPEFHKPSPKAFRDIILHLFSRDIFPENILYIGDNEKDFRASCGAGLHFAGITTGGPTTREDFLVVGVHERLLLSAVPDLPGLLGK